MACSFLMYWAGFQKPDMVESVKHNAELLKENPSQLMLLCGIPLPVMDKHEE